MSIQQMKSGILARRRSRLVTFIVAETSAIIVLLVSGAFALSSLVLAHSVLAMSINVVTVVAAAAVAMIPVLFYAIAPVLPSGD